MPLEEEEVLHPCARGVAGEVSDLSLGPRQVQLLRQHGRVQLPLGVEAWLAVSVQEVLQQAALLQLPGDVVAVLRRPPGVHGEWAVPGLKLPDVAVVVVVHVRDERAVEAIDAQFPHALRQDLHECLCADVLLACVDEQAPGPRAHKVAVGAIQRVSRRVLAQDAAHPRGQLLPVWLLRSLPSDLEAREARRDDVAGLPRLVVNAGS
mmetsp:Transcript_20041/g.55163  ORF Transcript_20041/g.55163 Transcript_20041/m.55163 type:complete len:207 (+) Transcript_20041:815-1435(+)